MDEFGDGYAVFATSSRLVGLTEPVVVFLADVTGLGLRPVVMSRMDAVVSAQVALVLGRVGGFWAVQDVDGVTFDALTGRRITAVEDLWAPAASEGSAVAGVAVPADDEACPVRVLGFDVLVEHRARVSTRVGPVARVVVEALGGGRLDRWGVCEPLTGLWDEAAVTALVRSQMPCSQIVLAGGEGGGFVQVRVWRTGTGLAEHATGGVVARVGASTADLVDVASGALERLAGEFRVRVGVVSVAEYDRGPVTPWGGSGGLEGLPVGACGLVRGVRGYAPDAPLAVVLGVGAVGEMGVDVAGLSGRFDVRRVGPGRERGVLVRLSGGGGLWGQFADFAASVFPAAPVTTGRTG